MKILLSTALLLSTYAYSEPEVYTITFGADLNFTSEGQMQQGYLESVVVEPVSKNPNFSCDLVDLWFINNDLEQPCTAQN